MAAISHGVADDSVSFAGLPEMSRGGLPGTPGGRGMPETPPAWGGGGSMRFYLRRKGGSGIDRKNMKELLTCVIRCYANQHADREKRY